MVVAKIALLNWRPETWMTGGVAMLLVGGVIAMLVLELDYLTGILHVGMYFVVSMICRFVAGIGMLPGWMEWSEKIEQQTIPQQEGTIELMSYWSPIAFDWLASCLLAMG
jgi:hypothetical protein